MRRAQRFLALFLLLPFLLGCGRNNAAPKDQTQATGSMPLRYAQEFSVDYLEDGCALIAIGDDRFLLVPEGHEAPAETDAVILRQPVSDIYVASSSAMDLFRCAGALDAVSMTSTSWENWTVPEIGEMVREDEITYVGKYSAPDYEAVLDLECGLALENTMIYHNPAVKEQLERIGIPVIVERSSYESHPLGRLEWIKLYGLLTGHLEEAERFFEESVRQVEEVTQDETSGRTVAFFYITSSGAVNVRLPDDYMAKMIELAGGVYLYPETGSQIQNAMSSTEVQMESFYAAARDADILIYNGTVRGDPKDMEELLSLSPLLQDFKAMKNGDVWCTGQNMFQQTGATADMITDLHTVISQSGDAVSYLRRLEQ